MSNTLRGVLAEFIVTLAVGGRIDGVREEWAPYDLVTPDGITIEVKSAAYLQSWAQRSPSRISFAMGASRAWDAATGTYAAEVRRQAQVYVFALLAHADKQSIDPLDVSQWTFFVVASKTFEESLPNQKRVSLSRLQKIAGEAVSFDDLRAAVLRRKGE